MGSDHHLCEVLHPQGPGRRRAGNDICRNRHQAIAALWRESRAKGRDTRPTRRSVSEARSAPRDPGQGGGRRIIRRPRASPISRRRWASAASDSGSGSMSRGTRQPVASSWLIRCAAPASSGTDALLMAKPMRLPSRVYSRRTGSRDASARAAITTMRPRRASRSTAVSRSWRPEVSRCTSTPSGAAPRIRRVSSGSR